MELTAKTFSSLDDNFDLRQLISVRTANGLRIGRLPDSSFRANGVFVRDTFEIERMQCMALLSSGMLISIDERMTLTIPGPLSDGRYYLTVGFGKDIVEYEANEQAFVRPTYITSLQTLDEIETNAQSLGYAVFPALRFSVSEGRITIDQDFIAPCLIIASDERLQTRLNTIVEKLNRIANHANMEEGEGKRTLMQYIFKLRRFSKRNTTEHLMETLNEVANAIDYYIMTPNAEYPLPIQEWSLYDVELWLSWIEGYMEACATTLDGVVLVDKSIDYEALKAELRKEIFEMIEPDMQERIENARQSLHAELQTKLSEALKDYIDGTFKHTLHDYLHQELSDELQQKLYDSLYKALYDALYIPPAVEEDNFMPLI